jgi:hypothetical protein
MFVNQLLTAHRTADAIELNQKLDDDEESL